MTEEIKNIEESVARQNDFCVISKETFGDHGVHDIQTNSAWFENPYGDVYAVVPDEMVEAILDTMGFCDITLNDDGTEVVSFVPREIPEIEQAVGEPTQLDKIEAQITYTAMMTDTLIV